MQGDCREVEWREERGGERELCWDCQEGLGNGKEGVGYAGEFDDEKRNEER